jgi:hypothetical protein
LRQNTERGSSGLEALSTRRGDGELKGVDATDEIILRRARFA